jgi:hypothetical protein
MARKKRSSADRAMTGSARRSGSGTASKSPHKWQTYPSNTALDAIYGAFRRAGIQHGSTVHTIKGEKSQHLPWRTDADRAMLSHVNFPPKKKRYVPKFPYQS